MIKKRINKPIGLSNDAIISIIELHLAETYKTTRVSDSRLNIRKFYKFNSANSQEIVHKQMNFKDSGFFIVNDDAILFRINLRKQFLFWMFLLVLGVFVTCKLWNASLMFSIVLITTPILLIWIIGIFKLNKFMSNEVIEISKELGV